jgi:hypothetical protein
MNGYFNNVEDTVVAMVIMRYNFTINIIHNSYTWSKYGEEAGKCASGKVEKSLLHRFIAS